MDSEQKFFDNRKAGKSTPITRDPITVGRGAMVWITYKFARVEQNCGRKGGLFNRLRIVETKACSRYLGDFNRVTQPSLRPIPGLREVRVRGCMELRKSKRRRSKKRTGVNNPIYKTNNDGLSKFYD